MKAQTLPFAILKPVQTQPDLSRIHLNLSADDLVEFIENFDETDYLVVDIETKGNTPHTPESHVVGFGLGDKRGCGYWTAEHWPLFLSLAQKRNPRLIGHNIVFDAAYATRDFGWLNWSYCTYGAYKHLASEGWKGQRWSLKAAQKDLLGWAETNEGDLDAWLVKNGYHKGARKNLDSLKNKSTWYELEDGSFVKPDKAEMWRAPAEILGKYCALDCQSTYLLFTQVMLPAIKKFHAYDHYHKEAFIPLVRAIIEQQLSGIRIDVDALNTHIKNLNERAELVKKEFLANPEVADAIREYNAEKLEVVALKEPPRYKAMKEYKEPKKYLKSGIVSDAWLKWEQRMTARVPEESTRWKAWNKKYQEEAAKQHFNLGSPKQLAWLYYTKLKYEPLLYTKTGSPATDNKALGAFGTSGKQLIALSKIMKELGYAESLLTHQINGVLYPQFRVPGTLTGRLSGTGGLNMQQMPKSKEFLSCFIPREGYKWIDFDFVALEPVVLTELSRDKNLLKIYGPGAKPNDIYIFNGYNLPGMRDVFAACGYDPDNPTKDAISKIKKEHKALRAIAKLITLSAQYGAGPNKIHQTLKLQGQARPIEDVQAMHQAYWKTYEDVKSYERFLRKMWEKNRGWILNGFGRPIAIHEDYIKDIVNRQVQGTGHDSHMFFMAFLRKILDKQKGLKWRYIIADFHDEAIFEVEEGQEQRFIACLREAERELQAFCKSYVPVQIDPAVGKCLADFKISE